MGKLLLPVLLLIIGVGAGVGAGLVLKPDYTTSSDVVENHGDDAKTDQSGDHDTAGHGTKGGEADAEYVKLNNQFVVPVVKNDKIVSLVVLSLSVEVNGGRREEVYSREPKLRDAFLQVLFDHANMGGFRGAFTSSNNMAVLRQALQETARKVADDLILDVQILDINRQDV